MSALFGPMMILVFCLSQALRDVYFGKVFQGVDFFAVIFLSFLASTIIFTVATLIRAPGEFRKLRSQWNTVVAMNVTTALAWSSYFFALTHLEPSVVNTIHSGMGPLTVVLLGVSGVRLAQAGHVNRAEAACYVAVALSIAGLWWVVLSGWSGLPVGNIAADLASLALLMVSGTSITISMLYSKRLHDHGVSAEAVTALRYPLLVAISGAILIYKGRLAGIETFNQLAFLSAAGTLLIVLPLFAMQIGIARTKTLTSNVIRALGPVFIFALEQFDGRTHYSAPVLACIVIYSVAIVAGNIAHGWRDRPRREPATSRARTQPARG